MFHIVVHTFPHLFHTGLLAPGMMFACFVFVGLVGYLLVFYRASAFLRLVVVFVFCEFFDRGVQNPTA